MAQDSPVKTGRTPVPYSPSQVIQRPASDCWETFKHHGLTADEVIKVQARKNPVPPSLDPPVTPPDPDR